MSSAATTVRTSRLQYYRRIYAAYLTSEQSQLTFWHDRPERNPNASRTDLGEYYMLFATKADYARCDDEGIPLLHYHGEIGLQYNPIAIAQYGLGNYNLYCRTREPKRRRKFLAVADWLVRNLEQNRHELWVWNHHFDWEYRTPLRAPWYSGLAQGQGISLLLRAHRASGDATYLEAAQCAFQPFLASVAAGGVTYEDEHRNLWFEEYIVNPPTHILNGFIWAAWGIYDYKLATGEAAAAALWERAIQTLRANLHRYDTGYWSLYEQSGTRMKMLASPFYHDLHITQLQVLHWLTGEESFLRYAERWLAYRASNFKRLRALAYKSLFKLCYY
jgi:heparosan-N-sulfate-glucuronate 5-epimerase